MAPSKRASGGGKNDVTPAPPQPPPPRQEQQQLDCWACDATVAVPLDPETGRPALAFSCGWCGAVTRMETEEEQREEGGGGRGGSSPRDRQRPGGSGGERHHHHHQRPSQGARKKKARLSAPRRLLAKILLPLASALSIAAATVLGVGWVLPALFDEARSPGLLLLADAAAAVVSFNVAVHFCALVAQALGVGFGGGGSAAGPKRVVVAAAGVGRTPEDEDTVSVSFSGDSGAAFSGGGSGSVVSGGASAGGGGGGGGSTAAAVFVGSSVPRGAYAGHERCELCVEAAARRSSERKEKRRRSENNGGREILAASQQTFLRPFPAAAPPPPPRASFSPWRKRGHRPPGAAHCLVCDACVADVDHHCSFVGTCVSLRAGKREGGAATGESGEQEEGATTTAAATATRARRKARQPRHHPSGRHFALLLFWLLLGSLYASLGSVALLAGRRREVEASLRRAASVALQRRGALLLPALRRLRGPASPSSQLSSPSLSGL